jgi:hypothetical protein
VDGAKALDGSDPSEDGLRAENGLEISFKAAPDHAFIQPSQRSDDQIARICGLFRPSLAATHQDLVKRLDALEEKTELLAMQHETFSRNTRVQLKQVFDALRELMTPLEPPKRPIGFVTPEEKKKPASKKR